RLRQAAAGCVEIAVEPQSTRRPIISHAAAAEHARSGTAWADHIRLVDARRAAAREVHYRHPARRIEVACGPDDGIRHARRDRADRRLGCGGEWLRHARE